MSPRFLLLVCAAGGTLGAQEPPPQPVPSIGTIGEAVIAVQPDQARLNIAVVTQARTAAEAAGQNARLAQAVLAELRKAAGAGAEVRTTGYSLEPNYRYPKPGGPPEIVNCTARNTIEVVTSDLAGTGKLIDAALAAGANGIDGLRFALKDEQAVHARALQEAARRARASAEAMAAALGVRIVRILSVEEAGAPRPVDFEAMRAPMAAAPTPVAPGTVEVRATVHLRAAIQ